MGQTTEIRLLVVVSEGAPFNSQLIPRWVAAPRVLQGWGCLLLASYPCSIQLGLLLESHPLHSLLPLTLAQLGASVPKYRRDRRVDGIAAGRV
jgi:hypothetical protein